MAASFLLSFLAASVAGAADMPVLPPPPLPHSAHNADKDFTLRHIFHHGTYRYPELHRRIDVPEHAAVWTAGDEDAARREPVPRLRVRSETMSIQRLADRSKETITGILEWGRRTGRGVQLPEEDWTIDDIAGPNVTDRETVLSFARMASHSPIPGSSM